MIVEPAQVPVPFTLDYSHVATDQDATYSLQGATIIDGDRTWVTTTGTPAITKGNPTSGLTLALAFRADVLKGDVTGSISGVDITLGDEAFPPPCCSTSRPTRPSVSTSSCSRVDPDPVRDPLRPARSTRPPTTSWPPGIVHQEERWANREGVPAITKGNPIADVTIPVSAVVPSTTSTETDDGRSSLVIVLLALALLAAAIFVYQRSRSSEPAIATAPAASAPAEGEDMPEAPGRPRRRGARGGAGRAGARCPGGRAGSG